MSDLSLLSFKATGRKYSRLHFKSHYSLKFMEEGFIKICLGSNAAVFYEGKLLVTAFALANSLGAHK